MRNFVLIGVVASLALEGCLDFSQCTWCVDGGSGGGPDAGSDGGSGGGRDGGPGGGRDGGSDAGCAQNLWNTQLGSYPPNTCAVVNSGLVNGAGTGEFLCDAGALSAGTQLTLLPPPPGLEICAHADVPIGGIGGKLEVGCFACPADGGGCKCSQQSDCVQSAVFVGPQTVGPFRIPPLNCQTLDVFFQLPSLSNGYLQFVDTWVWQQIGDGGCAWNAAASCPTP